MSGKYLSALALAVALAAPVQAAIIQHTSRTDWTAAVGGPIQTETFNGFGSDASFQGGPVSILNGSIVEVNGPPANGANINKIDVPPFNFTTNLDGTPYASIDVGGSNDTMVQIDFLSPVSAWGADVSGLNWVSVVNHAVLDLFDESSNLIGTVPGLPGPSDFYGFQLDSGELASRIVFRFEGNAGANDGFGFDNASFVAQDPVPEPSTVVLSLLGLVALGWARRRNPAGRG